MSELVKFTHGCLRTPLDPRSKIPKPLYERKKSEERKKGEEEDQEGKEFSMHAIKNIAC